MLVVHHVKLTSLLRGPTTTNTLYVNGNTVLNVTHGTTLVAGAMTIHNLLNVNSTATFEGPTTFNNTLNVTEGGAFIEGGTEILGGVIIEGGTDASGESIFKDADKIATFQSSGANSFIELENNNGATDGTSLGYFDDGNSNYFYINAPTPNFGDLVINEFGLVGIATTTPSFKLEVNGTAGKPGGGFWSNSTSDRRLKKSIKSYNHGLQEILQIRPVWYQYIDRFDLPVNQDFVGIIAQEIQEIAPYMVGVTKHQNEEGEIEEYLNFDGSSLTFMLVNAVQEQEKTINEQKEIVEKQQIQISQLLDEMVEIQKLLRAQVMESEGMEKMLVSRMEK